MQLTNLGRLWRTIKYLRAEQITGRVIFRLRRPQPDLSPPPATRLADGNWIAPALRQKSLVGPETFILLGTRCNIDEDGWDAPYQPKLLRYNLQYFDDLNATDSALRIQEHRALIERWIMENPPTVGSGWEPYPLSLRIINWIKWAQTHEDVLSFNAKASLAVQARYLAKRLEWHLLGNHLFVNAKALIFAGLFFKGPEAAGWLHTGFSILKSQIPEQILSDGGQFELSPMYHALAIEDMLDLVNITRRFKLGLPLECIAIVDEWAELLPKMISWLQAMTHPDGKIAFFNDAAFGIAPDNAELINYAKRLSISIPEPPDSGIHALPESGYFRLTRNDAVAIIDLAAVGPDYLPGHAHADTLSFELSVRHQRVVVNGGTSVYGVDAERQRQRGTMAHSTLCLEGHNSSDVWGGFRVGRRAKVSGIRVWESCNILHAEAAHDGYAHLRGKPLHRREWKLGEHRLVVVDHLEGNSEQNAVLNFHLSPTLDAISEPDGTISLYDTSGRRLVRVTTSHPAGLQILSSSWHPEFGLSQAIKCLSIHFHSSVMSVVETAFEWSNS